MAYLRPAPRTVEQTGLPFLFLVSHVAKALFVRGQIGAPELCAHLKLSNGVVETVMAFMRAEKLCEVTRRGGSNTDADLNYTLTEAGRQRASEALGRSAYAGPAPVALSDYCEQVQAQQVSNMGVRRTDVENTFAHVVVDPDVIVQLGAAMNSGRAMLIHGLPGSGKTYLAEMLASLLHGDILVPHAVLVDGEVIQILDHAVHKPAVCTAPAAEGIDRRLLPDTRWVRCARPTMLTGGELTIDMLDLRFDAGTRCYQAPPHLKANNGLFIIDDLGRQRCSPSELMNRWIVPLDRHVDYLTLHTGHKFMVPFDVVVVFSSNFSPDTLADDAFLRRLGYKIEVGAHSEATYEQILRAECRRHAMPWSDDAFHYLLHEKHYKQGRPLLACYPRDLVTQVRNLARYEGTDAVFNEAAVDWAWNNYFVGT